jgi:hypothetical protein
MFLQILHNCLLFHSMCPCSIKMFFHQHHSSCLQPPILLQMWSFGSHRNSFVSVDILQISASLPYCSMLIKKGEFFSNFTKHRAYFLHLHSTSSRSVQQCLFASLIPSCFTFNLKPAIHKIIICFLHILKINLLSLTHHYLMLLRNNCKEWCICASLPPRTVLVLTVIMYSANIAVTYFYCCTVHFISVYQEKPTNALKKYFKNTH